MAPRAARTVIELGIGTHSLWEHLEPTSDSPMWTPTTRQQHSRIVTQYQTDLTLKTATETGSIGDRDWFAGPRIGC